MKKYKLDTEEKELMATINSGKWQKSTDIDDEISTHIEYAKNFLEKDKKVSIRISSKDLELIQRKASEEGLSYQSFLSTILHKYINNVL